MITPEPTENEKKQRVHALFDALVYKGEQYALITLSQILHVFLVSCLIEYLREDGGKKLFDEPVTFTLLHAGANKSESGKLSLRHAGDESLLIAGLFPAVAKQRGVSVEFFRSMGQTAYTVLGNRYEAEHKLLPAGFYRTIGMEFVRLETVLAATRTSDDEWRAYQWFRQHLE